MTMNSLGPARRARGRAERIVVVVEHAEPSLLERNHALDGLEREREDGPEPAEVVRVGDLQQVRDLVLTRKPSPSTCVEIDEKDLLERGRGALVVVALDDQKQVVVDAR